MGSKAFTKFFIVVLVASLELSPAKATDKTSDDEIVIGKTQAVVLKQIPFKTDQCGSFFTRGGPGHYAECMTARYQHPYCQIIKVIGNEQYNPASYDVSDGWTKLKVREKLISISAHGSAGFTFFNIVFPDVVSFEFLFTNSTTQDSYDLTIQCIAQGLASDGQPNFEAINSLLYPYIKVAPVQ